MYNVLKKRVEECQPLEPSEIYSLMDCESINYNSIQKRMRRLIPSIDNILDPYLDTVVCNPQLNSFLRNELIRFGAYVSEVMCLDDTSGRGQNTATLRADNYSLQQKNQSLEHQNSSLTNRLTTEVNKKDAELERLQQQYDSVVCQLQNSLEDKKQVFELAREQQSSFSRQLEDVTREKRQAFSLLESQQSQISRQLDDFVTDKEHAHSLALAQQREIEMLLSAQPSVFDSNQAGELMSEVYKIQESLYHQQGSLSDILTATDQHERTNLDALSSLKTGLSEVLSHQRSIPDVSSDVARLFGALGELKTEVVTLSSIESIQDTLHGLKSDISAALSKPNLAHKVSADVTRLNEVFNELKAEVIHLSRIQSSDPTLKQLVHSNVSIIEQLEHISSEVKEHSSNNIEQTLNDSLTQNRSVLCDIEHKVAKVASSQVTSNDMKGLNRTFDFLGKMLKEVIAVNQEFEDRIVVPVESVSHLVKTNESLHSKIERLSDEKRDAVKQLSNMIKATSTTAFKKTNGVEPSAILELKSRISTLEGELMKSKEDRSVLRRQVNAKQKRLDGLLIQSAANV
jgi:hypothetical protein